MPSDVRKYYRKESGIIELYAIVYHDPEGVCTSVTGAEEGTEVTEQEYLDQESARVAQEEAEIAAEAAERQELIDSAMAKSKLVDLTPAEFVTLLSLGR